MATPRSYDYKKPRRVNVVSVGLALLAAALVYLGVKLVPVYWDRYKVGEIVDQGATLAAGIRRYEDDSRIKVEEDVVEKTRKRIEDRGLDEDPDSLLVYFDEEYETLNAEYDVTVRFVGGKSLRRHFHLTATIAP